MNTALAFLFFALGIALDAAHNRIRREGESRAYSSGYRQAQKEENIRITARLTSEAENGAYAAARRQSAQTFPSDAEPASDGNVISTNFWNDLQANGRAAVRIQR